MKANNMPIIDRYYHSRIVESLRRENEELKAKLDKAKWQPIESAPRDGRKIDIWVDYPYGGERYENAHFAKDENAFCWDIHETGKRVVFTATPPSHWMPLPAAPQQSTGDGV